MVHQRGIKILAYASSGYFSGSDPDFRKEWARPGDICGANWWDLPRCSPASPGWRAYVLPRMLNILDEYGVDGLYNDWGYVPNAAKRIKEPAKDEMAVFEETPDHDGAVADLLHLIYSEVKRRGGIYKMHADRSNRPLTGGLKVYDYLWVGENVTNADGLREAVKDHPPYVVPCIQGTAARIEKESDHFLHSIPYMQFPLLQGGRPLTGERGVIPIPRLPGAKENGFYTRAWEYYKKHPDGPYIYGGWDPIPPNPEDAAGPRALAETVHAAGRGRHLGVSGNRRFRLVRAAAAERLHGFRVRKPGVVPGSGQLRPDSPDNRNGRRICSYRYPFGRPREKLGASETVVADRKKIGLTAYEVGCFFCSIQNTLSAPAILAGHG